MPGNLAFPGGKLEAADGGPEAGGIERCASRELLEETGIEIPPGSWREAGARVTPPLFPVRFDARVFVVEAPGGMTLPRALPSPDEIDSLEFFRPAEVVERWEAGRALVPPPVLAVLRGLDPPPDGIDALIARVREVNAGEERHPRIEFVPGIWTLPVRTRTLPPATHTNVWMPGKEAFAIVDPGSDEDDEIERLLEVVARHRDETGARPVAVVLTHHHDDHVAGAARVATELAVPVRAHAETLSRVDLDGARAEAVKDGDGIDLGGETMTALHTPGHAPGHLAFHLSGPAVLLAGDLISGLSTILIDPVEGRMGEYLDSVRRVEKLGCRRVLPAHGPPLSGKALDRLVTHREEREGRIHALLGTEPRRLDEIAREAYPDAPEAPEVLKRSQTLAHLFEMERRGVARRSRTDGIAWIAAGDDG
jgi:glyoxylase-like metal-dependent hydrolase (beta-lactamase superfamily II)/8-oxo-dGTP pyrophosphatase MutT (NUDIX family)